METQRLLDAITDHLAVYHRGAPTPSSESSQSRQTIIKWMASLSIDQRRAALTVWDGPWVEILLMMQEHVRDGGPCTFFLLPDVPVTKQPKHTTAGSRGSKCSLKRADNEKVSMKDCRQSRPRGIKGMGALGCGEKSDKAEPPTISTPLPALCVRKARGLLRRLESRQTSGALLVNNIRLFSSEGGVNMCNASNLNAGFVPDCITVTENFVSNMDTFVDVMNEISFGEFLKTPCLTAVSSWEEMPWLKASGYYSIPAFIANKFEFGLWSAWSRAQGPKRPPRSLVLKSKIGWSANSSATCTNGNAGLGATLFERQQGWKEWWRKLGSKERTKVATGAVFLVTKSEVVKLHEEATRSNVLDPGFSGCCQSMSWNPGSVKGNAISRKVSSGLDIDALPRVRRADHRGTTVAPYLICLQALKEISEAGFLFGKTEGMNPLQEDGDSWLFDSSLMSVHSFSDRVRRKVRNALFKVRNDMVEFELLGDEPSDKVRRVGGAENTKVKTTKAKKKRRKSSVLPKLHVYQGRENSANLGFSHSKVGKPQLQAESEPAGPGIEIQNLDHQIFESTAVASSVRGEEVIRQGKGVKLSKELKSRHAVPDYPTRNEDTNCSDDTYSPYFSSGMCKDPNSVSFPATSDAESLLCTETSFNISVADDSVEQGRSDACMSQLEKEKLGSILVPAVLNLPSVDNSANFTEKDGNLPENLILTSCNSPLVDSFGNDHNYDDANAHLSEGSAGVREHLTWSPSDPRLKVQPECQVSNQIQGDILKPVLDTSSLHDVERRTHAKGEYEGPVPIRFGTVDGSLPELKSSSCATIMAKAFANAITAEPGSDVALDRKAENDLPQTVWNRRDTVALVSGYESKEETLELAVSDGQSASRPGSVRPRFTKTSKQFDHSNSRHLQYQRSQAFRTRPHEWPGSPQISYFGSYHRPTAPDWLQLDEGSGWPHRVQSPFVTYSNSTVLRQQGGQIERPTLRSVASWASNVGSMDRASAGQPSYNVSPVGGYGISSQEEPRLNVRPTLNATPFSSGCSELETSSPGRKLCLEKEDRFAYDTDGDDCGICRSLEFDDLDGYVISEEEGDKFTDAPESSSADYNQIFGGGVMYWNAADYTGLGYSRPGSLSSEDSSWARHEADLSAVLDDIVNYQPLQASFSAKAPANSSGRSCSSSPPSSSSVPISFDHLGPSLNSRLCKPRAGMDFSGKFVHLTNQGVTADDHSVGTRVPVTLEVMEQFGADSSTKPVLRPIVVVRDLSRQTSGVDVCRVQETKSPHIASRSRRESSGHRRRPPSPVSRCVPPPAPPPPPPSPVSGPRRRKGFMAARSGSSSPRHWGFINWSHKDESKWPEVPGPERNEDSGLRRGSLGTTSARHSVSGAVLRERLVPTLPVEQEHPVVSTPMKTTLLHNSNPAFHLVLSKLLSILNLEIGAFKWQVETENKQRRPFIDIAVKKVEHSLQVLWPRSRTNIFGSVATGLALPTSDVDLVVYLPPVRNLEPIKEAGILEGRNGIKETCLQHAARYLADQDWVKNDSMKIIENTTVPVIMMVAEFLPQQCGTGDEDVVYSFGAHNPKESLEEAPRVKSEESKRLSGPGFCKEDKSLVTENPNGPWGGISARQLVHLDISFETPFHTGLRTADLVRELVGQYPALSPLALVLKQFLTDRSLDRPYTGGLSSYCLVLLITRFLQHQQRGKPSSNQVAARNENLVC